MGASQREEVLCLGLLLYSLGHHAAAKVLGNVGDGAQEVVHHGISGDNPCEEGAIDLDNVDRVFRDDLKIAVSRAEIIQRYLDALILHYLEVIDQDLVVRDLVVGDDGLFGDLDVDSVCGCAGSLDLCKEVFMKVLPADDIRGHIMGEKEVGNLISKALVVLQDEKYLRDDPCINLAQQTHSMHGVDEILGL